MQERFTLNRSGTFYANQRIRNQCRAPGHTDYDYLIKIVCGNRLDHNGFIIDHHKIHDTVIKTTGRIGSCEELCQGIEMAVRALCKTHNVLLHKMYVRIRARSAPDLNYAFMEYEVEY